MKILQRVPTQILIETEKLNKRMTREKPMLSNIKDRVNSTPSHVTKVTQELQKEGLIRKSRQGRTSKIQLTNQGKKVTDNIKRLRQTIEKTQVKA